MKTFKNKQTGAALAIGMMLLLIISAIGITSMKSAILQEKMAAGLKNRENADAAALVLLRAAEKWLFNYYKQSNDTILSPGIGAVIEPRSDMAYNFRSERNLSDGWTHPGGLVLKNIFSLADEPRYIIEDFESIVDVAGGGSGTSFTTTDGESDNSNAGSNDGQDGSDTFTVLLYRLVSKANDSTGHLYTGFESVYSTVVR